MIEKKSKLKLMQIRKHIFEFLQVNRIEDNRVKVKNNNYTFGITNDKITFGSLNEVFMDLRFVLGLIFIFIDNYKN